MGLCCGNKVCILCTPVFLYKAMSRLLFSYKDRVHIFDRQQFRESDYHILSSDMIRSIDGSCAGYDEK